MRKRVLFLCTGNSARSQMAEALLRAMGGPQYEAFSAGTEPKGLHPLTVQVMREIGIDTSWQDSKSVDQFSEQNFDFVITVCDSARQQCPVFSGANRMLHWSLEDPAAAGGNAQDQLNVFRDARDQIRQRVKDFLAQYDKES